MKPLGRAADGQEPRPQADGSKTPGRASAAVLAAGSPAYSRAASYPYRRPSTRVVSRRS
jgi:hypothetical protein